MTERRFNDTEVATIIERATTRQDGGRQMAPTTDGMTLSQLQEIGRDIGIDPRDMADAADSLETTPTTVRGLLGLPLRVERIVPLRRKLTDEEWERVVVDLRETFDARGVMKGEGTLRQWTNGNLQALLEPTTDGQRVRLRTFKGDAMPRLFAGAVMVAMPAISIVAGLGSNINNAALLAPLAVAVGGAAFIGLTIARVSRWAQARREQMEGLAARLRRVASDQSQFPDHSRAERP